MSANASMMIPKKMFSKIMLITRKNPKSKIYLVMNIGSSLALYVIASPRPPPALIPTFVVERKHCVKSPQYMKKSGACLS